MHPAKFSEILDAFEFCAFGNLMNTQGYVSLERGTVHIVSEDMELDGSPPEDLEDGPYVALPDKMELNLGKALAVEFTQSHLLDQLPTVLGFFSRPGAYGRFKALLERQRLLADWHAFETAATEARLRQWCEAQGIVLAPEASAGR